MLDCKSQDDGYVQSLMLKLYYKSSSCYIL